MDKLDCTAEPLEGHDTFQFKLTVRLGEAATYYYGTGTPGVPEGAQWYDPIDGMPMSAPIADAVRGWLRAKAEYVLGEERKAKMAALMDGTWTPPAPEPEPKPEPPPEEEPPP